MVDNPQQFSGDSIIGPARFLFNIVPDDAADFAHHAKAIYVGTGGNLTVRTIDSAEPITLCNVVSGSILAIRLRAVLATGTTAGDLVGLG